MKSINRMFAILKPRQPYLDWINLLPGDLGKPSLDEICGESTGYLIPIYDTNEQALEFVLKNAKRLLEVELGAWDASGEHWPKTLNRTLLKSLFEIEICSEVFDTMSGEIERDEV